MENQKRKSVKFLICIVMLAMIMSPVSSLADQVTPASSDEPWLNTSTNDTYATLNDAVSNATAGDVIQLTESSAEVSSSVTIDKEITIDLVSADRTLTSTVSGTSATEDTFLVTSSGKLTIKSGCIAGPYSQTTGSITKDEYNAINTQSRAIEGQSGSTIALSGVTIKGFATTTGNGGAVLATGSDLSIENSKLGVAESGNYYGNIAKNGGAIYAEGDGASVTIKNSSLLGNISCDSAKTSEAYTSGGGAVYFGKPSAGKITGSTIQGNTAYGYGGAVYMYKADNVEISDNTEISSNKSERNLFSSETASGAGGAGGAFYIRFSKNITIKDNAIYKNSASNGGNEEGGGIYLVSRYNTDSATITGNKIYQNSTGMQGGGIRILFVGENITLKDNNVYSNSAKRGGGMSIYDVGIYDGEEINFESGKIMNNTATDCGGGIDYTHHDCSPLYLRNVLITNNEAARGGGIWSCPTSTTTMYATQGGAIYRNTASGSTSSLSGGLSASGDDTRYEGSDTPDTWATQNIGTSSTSSFTAISRALGGGRIDWYADEAEDRYQAGDTVLNANDYENRTTSFGMHAELNADAKTLAENEAKIIISGNVAGTDSSGGRGGGIATNSPVIIGLDEDVNVSVTKTWSEDISDDDMPDVYVELYRVDANGDKVKIEDHVKLEKSGENLATTFEDLPSSYVDDNGDTQKYTYEVKEEPVNGWTADIETAYDDSTNTYNVSIKNSPAKTVDITYHADNGEAESLGINTASTMKLTFGKNIVVAEVENSTDHEILSNDVTKFTNDGYTFTGWNTKEDGTGKAYSPGDVLKNVSGSEDLYAQWEATSGDNGSTGSDKTSGKTAQSGKTSGKTARSVKKTPADTGDDIAILVAALAALSAIAVCTAMVKKRRRNEP